jgi:hypothetical protein
MVRCDRARYFALDVAITLLGFMWHHVVAVQANFETTNFETGFSLYRFKG